jgi:hypothetical protein
MNNMSNFLCKNHDINLTIELVRLVPFVVSLEGHNSTNYLTLRPISSLNNPQNSEMKI